MGLVSEVICGLTCASVDITTHALNFFVDVDTYLHCIPYVGFKQAHDDCFGHYKETNKELSESIKEDLRVTKEIIDEHTKNKKNKKKGDNKKENSTTIIHDDGTVEVVQEDAKVPLLTQKDFTITNNEKIPTPQVIDEMLTKYGFMFSTIKGEDPFNAVEIYRNNTVNTYVYESGQIFGSGINFIFTNNNSIIPISIEKDPDIVERMLNTPDFIITQDEINRAISRMLPNYTLYKNFDMKGMTLNRLSQEEMKTLSDKLTALINIYTSNENKDNLPRFRFTKFESVDKFYLKSDDKVNRPKKLIDLGLCSSIVCGDSIKVEGDMITVKCNDKETKTYKIEYK